MVELFGRIDLNAYTNMQGEVEASLTFHVNNIKIHQFMKEEILEEKRNNKRKKKEDPVEDLPF